MKRRAFFIALVSFVAGALLYQWWHNDASRRDADELNHELQLARAEGMPTTWQEYAAQIKPARPEENAAELYRRLKPRQKNSANLSALDASLALSPTEAHSEAVAAEVKLRESDLEAIDRATQLPRCWFNRDWSKGPAVLMPEYAFMKNAAKLLCLRGTLAASQGRQAQAIGDIRKALKVARHASDEGVWIGHLVEDSIFSMCLHHLALWAYAGHRDDIYLREMRSVLEQFPKPDLQQGHRDDYLLLSTVLRLSTTREGLRDLGIRDSDQAPAENVMATLFSRHKADISVARAMRHLYEAYGAPPKNRQSMIDAAWQETAPMMVAYPTGSSVYFQLVQLESGPSTMNVYDLDVAARCLQYQAVLRAITRSGIAKRIDTSDLRSPFDEKPLEYFYNGRQITVRVSCPEKAVEVKPLTLPSDDELKVAQK